LLYSNANILTWFPFGIVWKYKRNGFEQETTGSLIRVAKMLSWGPQNLLKVVVKVTFFKKTKFPVVYIYLV